MRSFYVLTCAISAVAAVHYHATSLKMASSGEYRIDARVQSPAGQTVLGGDVDSSRCYLCSAPCSQAVCCHGEFPQCCTDGRYCYCCED